MPRLCGILGVVEINTMGGDLEQYQVITKPDRIAAHNSLSGQAPARTPELKHEAPCSLRQLQAAVAVSLGL